ncbi:MAG TPA: SHOCT domain-containing protein, partial [Actinomycetota bacterium]
AAPAPAAAAGGDMMAQLQQLAAMNAQGVLTDEEFAAAKARLLAG